MQQTWPGLHGYNSRPPVDWSAMGGVNMAAHSAHVARSGSAPSMRTARPAPRQSAAVLASRVHGLRAVSDTPGMDVAAYDWGDVFKSLALTGGQIAQQTLAPLNPGEYVQTAAGVRANAVAGAVPGQYPGTGVNVGGISTGTILLLVAGGVAVVWAMNRGGRR